MIIPVKEYNLPDLIKRCRRYEANGYECVKPIEKVTDFNKQFVGGNKFAGHIKSEYYQTFYRKVN